MQTREDHLAVARDLTMKAARWLALLRFQGRPGTPMFLFGLSTYHDMFDPDATDVARFLACKRMLPAVERQKVVESWKAEEALALNGPMKPHRLEWHTTLLCAALETVADLLREAIDRFRSAGTSAEE